jgi:hypothetical protein
MPVGPNVGCLCQTAPTNFPPPLKCANEGENCQCAGKVFFGASVAEEGLYNSFSEFTESPYAVRMNVYGNVSCMAD